MKNKSIICGIVVMIFASGCGVPQSDYDKLKEEHERLKTELDELKFGAERIVAAVEKAYDEKKYSLARENIGLLHSKHPESPKNEEFKNLLKTIEKKELEEKKRRKAEEKERVRLANINNTGMWRVLYYVDEFGEPTEQGYITNTKTIVGTFSNTATQDSPLNVEFLITNSSRISIQLYEYAGNNPVKSYSHDSYTVLVQDKDMNRMTLIAENTSERLFFSAYASRQIHNALMKGGTLKFRITDDDTPTAQYQFDIQKADWYENAYRKLEKS
jgi:hypothetical protein